MRSSFLCCRRHTQYGADAEHTVLMILIALWAPLSPTMCCCALPLRTAAGPGSQAGRTDGRNVTLLLARRRRRRRQQRALVLVTHLALNARPVLIISKNYAAAGGMMRCCCSSSDTTAGARRNSQTASSCFSTNPPRPLLSFFS